MFSLVVISYILKFINCIIGTHAVFLELEYALIIIISIIFSKVKKFTKTQFTKYISANMKYKNITNTV